MKIILVKNIFAFCFFSVLRQGDARTVRVKRGEGLNPFALSALAPIFRRAGPIGFSANEYYARSNPIVPPQFYPISSPFAQYYPEHSFLPYHAFNPPVYDYDLLKKKKTSDSQGIQVTAQQIQLLQLLSENSIIEQVKKRTGTDLTLEEARFIKQNDAGTVASLINQGKLGEAAAGGRQGGIPIRPSQPTGQGGTPPQQRRPFTTTPEQLDILKTVQPNQISDVVYRQTGAVLTPEQLQAMQTVPSNQLADEINNRKGVWATIESQMKAPPPQTGLPPPQQAGNRQPLGTGGITSSRSYPFVNQQTGIQPLGAGGITNSQSYPFVNQQTAIQPLGTGGIQTSRSYPFVNEQTSINPLGGGISTSQSYPFFNRQSSVNFPFGKRRKRAANFAGNPAAFGTPLGAGQAPVGFSASQYDQIRRYYGPGNGMAQYNSNIFFPQPYRPYFPNNQGGGKDKKKKKLLDGLPPLEKAPAPKPGIPLFGPKPKRSKRFTSRSRVRVKRQSVPSFANPNLLGRNQAVPFQPGFPAGRQTPFVNAPRPNANRPVSVANCLNYLQYFPPGPGFPQGIFIDGCGRQIPAELILGPGQDTQDPINFTPGPATNSDPDPFDKLPKGGSGEEDDPLEEKSDGEPTKPPVEEKPDTSEKPKTTATKKPKPESKSKPKTKKPKKPNTKPKSKPKAKPKSKPKAKPKSKAGNNKKSTKDSRPPPNPNYVIHKNFASIDRSAIRTATRRRAG